MPKLVEQSFEIVASTPNLIQHIERAARVCYLSEPQYGWFPIEEQKVKRDEFIKNLIRRGHESVLEHGSISVEVITNRSISHEIVRHRIASYSQESQRYCNYSVEEKFYGEIAFIKPSKFKEGTPIYKVWYGAMEEAQQRYMELIGYGASAEWARGVLPNDTKTKLFMTMNVREWRHLFKLRTDSAAHPQMRELTIPMLMDFAGRWPALFGDIVENLQK